MHGHANVKLTIPTDLPRLRSEDAHSWYAGSHPGRHLGHYCMRFGFNYFIPRGKCLNVNDRILARRLQFNIRGSSCTTLPYVFWTFNDRKYTSQLFALAVPFSDFNDRQDRQHSPLCCAAGRNQGTPFLLMTAICWHVTLRCWVSGVSRWR